MTDTQVRILFGGIALIGALAIGTVTGMVADNIISLRNHPEFSEKRNPA